MAVKRAISRLSGYFHFLLKCLPCGLNELVDQVLRYSKKFENDIFLLNSLKRHLKETFN